MSLSFPTAALPTTPSATRSVKESERTAESAGFAEEYEQHDAVYTVRTLTLHEYRSAILWLSRQQANGLHRAGGGKYLTVEPAEPSGCWRVTAHNYVGSINVGGLQVLVRPKIPLRNLLALRVSVG